MSKEHKHRKSVLSEPKNTDDLEKCMVHVGYLDTNQQREKS
jgi:hypothetical protein